MASSKREKEVIAKWISELLAENQFVAFTRTPKGVVAAKQMRIVNTAAMDRLTTTTKEANGRKYVQPGR